MEKNFLVEKFKTQEIFSSLLYVFEENAVQVVDEFIAFLHKEIFALRKTRVFTYQHFQKYQAITASITFIERSLSFQLDFQSAKHLKKANDNLWSFFSDEVYNCLVVAKKLVRLKATATTTQKEVIDLWMKENLQRGQNREAGDTLIRAINKKCQKMLLNIDNSINDRKSCLIFERNNLSQLKGVSLSILKSAVLHARQLKIKNAVAFEPTQMVTTHLLSYIADANVRKKVYLNYVKNNSANMTHSNESLLNSLMGNKFKLAKEYNKSTYYDLVSENYFINKSDDVSHFLGQTQQLIAPYNEKVKQALLRCAASYGVDKLNVWDVLYFEKLMFLKMYGNINTTLKNKYEITLDYALKRVISFFREKFKVSITKCNDKGMDALTNKEVQVYKIVDKKNKKEGFLLFNLLKKNNKNYGFYSCRTVQPNFKFGRTSAASISIISGCFANKSSEYIPLTTVSYLMHEVGHAFQSFYASGSFEQCDIINYSWDLVEIPAQLMERFMFEEKTIMSFLTNKKDISVQEKSLDIKKWLDYYNFYSFTMLNEDLELNISKFNFFNEKKMPKSVGKYFNDTLNKALIFNPYNYSNFLESNYVVDYAASGYIYLLNDVFADNLYNNIYKNGTMSLSDIYKKVLNGKNAKRLHKNLGSGLDYSKMNLIDYINKGRGIDFKLLDSI